MIFVLRSSQQNVNHPWFLNSSQLPGSNNVKDIFKNIHCCHFARVV